MAERYDALVEIVAETNPTGGRFVFYRATVGGVVSKDDSGAEKVQRALLKLRRSGRVPYQWITDSTRWMRKPDTWDSAEAMHAEMAESYRRALWRSAGTAVEVWVESESAASVIYPITSRWDVPLYPCRGQSSDTFAFEAAQQYRNDSRSLVIYYVGDHDPAGMEIEFNLNRKLREFSGRDDLTFRRLACTAGQVAEFELSGTKAKKSHYRDLDRIRVPWTGQAVEVEALDPNYLRELVEDAIVSHIDPHALEITRGVERDELAGLRALAAGGWPG